MPKIQAPGEISDVLRSECRRELGLYATRERSFGESVVMAPTARHMLQALGTGTRYKKSL